MGVAVGDRGQVDADAKKVMRQVEWAVREALWLLSYIPGLRKLGSTAGHIVTSRQRLTGQDKF